MNGPDSKLSVERVHTCPLYIDMRVLSSVGGGAAMAAMLHSFCVCVQVWVLSCLLLLVQTLFLRRSAFKRNGP